MRILGLSPMKREILIKFGKKVRAERTKLGFSQEELAERAGVEEISRLEAACGLVC